MAQSNFRLGSEHKVTITLVINGKDKRGRIISHVSKWDNGRFVHMARRLAKSASSEAAGNWAEVICGDYSWYEHYEQGVLILESSKLRTKESN